MPIDLGLWRVEDDDTFRRVSSTKLDSEQRLEEFLLQDPNVLGQPLFVIDRQITTPNGNRLDILAMDEEGDLHIVELKRDRSPRDVTAQAIDYASWVRHLDYENVKKLYETSEEHHDTFEAGFDSAFYSGQDDAPQGPEEVNNQHTLTIVSSELDSSTERIIEYLSEEYNVPINAVRFNYYQEDDREYIARTWLNDPYEPEEDEEEDTLDPWNGYDFYANFGQNEYRRWADAREYGFITGGHGEWYHRTMGKATEGKRIFVNNPGEGYIGVGIVTQEKTAAPDFMVNVKGEEEEIPITEAPLEGDLSRDAEDPDLREYLIGVDWIQTRDIENAFWEKGMYANQNTVTRLRDQQTLDQLYQAFDVPPPEDT